MASREETTPADMPRGLPPREPAFTRRPALQPSVEIASAIQARHVMTSLLDAMTFTATTRQCDVLHMIEEYASPSMAPFQTAFAERCVSELSLDLQTPTGDRKYVNAYPPKALRGEAGSSVRREERAGGDLLPARERRRSRACGGPSRTRISPSP